MVERNLHLLGDGMPPLRVDVLGERYQNDPENSYTVHTYYVRGEFPNLGRVFFSHLSQSQETEIRQVKIRPYPHYTVEEI